MPPSGWIGEASLENLPVAIARAPAGLLGLFEEAEVHNSMCILPRGPVPLFEGRTLDGAIIIDRQGRCALVIPSAASPAAVPGTDPMTAFAAGATVPGAADAAD